MQQEVLSVGDQILIITRRLYDEDLRRHFIGRVLAASGGLIRVAGHAWVAGAVGKYERRPEERIRVFSATAGTEIMMLIPGDVDLDGLEYRATAIGRLILTDNSKFSVDLSEFALG